VAPEDPQQGRSNTYSKVLRRKRVSKKETTGEKRDVLQRGRPGRAGMG